MQKRQTKRKAPRVPVSFSVRCRQSDRNEIGAKAYNLSTGGIGIKTNHPLSVKERLDVTFQLPGTFNTTLSLSGEVSWSQFHGDTAVQEEALFAGGIKFLWIPESTRVMLQEYVFMTRYRQLYLKKN